MNFLQKHKTTIIVGLTSFFVGYVFGEYNQVRSFEREMANKIFNQVTESHKNFKR